MKKRRFFRRAFAIAALTTLASANAFGISTKYFKTDVTAATGGQVYASLDYVKPADTDYGTSKSTGTVTDSVSYVFAKPTTGYGFSHWTLNSGTLSDQSFDLTANPAMIVNAGSSTSQSSPATVSLTANFVATAVSVASDNEVFGTVSISQPQNAVGQTVTLIATPSDNIFKASDFEGWYLNGQKVDGMTATAQLTITNDNKGIYTAKFTRKAGYFRLRSQVANKYTYMFGTEARQSTSSEGFSGIVFDGSIAMKPAADLDLTDPGYIVKIDGITDLSNQNQGGLKDLDVTCQGVSARTMINAQYPTAIVNSRPSGNYWTFYYNYGGNDRYLKDGTYYPINYAIACGGASDHLWTLEEVDSLDIDFDIDFYGYKFTTLYTTFPYECPSGMTAQYAVSNNGNWELVNVPNNRVPSNTAVVLSAPSLQTENRVKLLFDEPTSLAGNVLKGSITLNRDSVAYDSSTMKVLGINPNTGILDFITSDQQYLESNRAYLDLTMLSASVRNLNGNAFTGISNIFKNERVDDSVYDMNGRKVPSVNLPKGMYIKQGRKFIVK